MLLVLKKNYMNEISILFKSMKYYVKKIIKHNFTIARSATKHEIYLFTKNGDKVEEHSVTSESPTVRKTLIGVSRFVTNNRRYTVTKCDFCI